MPATDEREGKPSASAMERLHECPGSYGMAKLIEAHQLPSGNRGAASIGTRIHRYLQTGSDKDRDALSEFELGIANDCKAHFEVQSVAIAVELDKLVPNWLDDHPTYVSELTEKRLWDLEHEYSGQADYLKIDNYHHYAVIFDYKTLGGRVQPAEENLQLRTLAALVYQQNPDLKWVFAAIIQPLSNKKDLVIYDKEALNRAMKQIGEIVRTARHSVRLNPGVWCQYCPALQACGPAQAMVMRTALEHGEGIKLSTSALCRLGAIVPMAEKLIENIKEQLRERTMEDPEFMLRMGYRMGKGAKVKKVKNAEAAMAILKPYLPEKGFLQACKVGNHDLEEAFAAAAMNAKLAANKTEAIKLLWSLLEEITETKESKAPLQRI